MFPCDIYYLSLPSHKSLSRIIQRPVPRVPRVSRTPSLECFVFIVLAWSGEAHVPRLHMFARSER